MECWGDNEFGELGDGTTTNKMTPTEVSGSSSGVTAISAGALYTCALTLRRRTPCWGDNEDGELGDGTTINKTTPVDVSGLFSAAAISAGGDHTCALIHRRPSDGVECWGNNHFGQLGDGTLPGQNDAGLRQRAE